MLSKFELPNKRPDERIVLTLRRHWFVLFMLFVKTIFFFLLPLVFFIVLKIESPDLLSNDILKPILILSGSLYYLFTWMLFFNSFVDYYLDIWIVTNQRIINIEQKNLFHRVISENNLERMQDITSDVKGFIPTFLNFGNIYVQTAGTKEHFVFKDIPDAHEVTQQILKLVQERKQQVGLYKTPQRNPINSDNANFNKNTFINDQPPRY